ncbi:type I-E CRISPR-associated protein Cse1/CasA [Pararhodospirillum photometricum]|uniref:CRISPR-associated protein, CT1972 family n=1 Tax=Pararhodospirillum photometricum DSM 122 TaxID=1150469 RepID=H6SSP0_PARPM|nr:type I-E CRISPR-associated protein Cse1/CasA [Pararhodospirillum photometricum]CCG07919.1 CRISPR-associated protein, CT1972 family [Pararhodospirillum photometricum DSM 122]
MDESLAPLQWLDVLLPVVRRSGARDRVCFADLTGGREDPVMGLDCPHPLLALSFELLATHILQIAYPPPDERTWRQRLFDPPSPAALRDALAPYREAFVLWGSDTPFLQVKPLSAWESKPQNLGVLFFDAPTEGAKEKHRDFFIKRGCAVALHAAFLAPLLYSDNALFCTGGGGYLGVPHKNHSPKYQVRGRTLWETLWLNVLDLSRDHKALWPVPMDGRAFPWLREDVRRLDLGRQTEHLKKKRTEAKQKVLETVIPVGIGDRHPAGFVMPRRYLLDPPRQGVCGLSGEVGWVFETYQRWTQGLSYSSEGWVWPCVAPLEKIDAEGRSQGRWYAQASSPLRLEDWLSPALGHEPPPPEGKSGVIVHSPPVVRALAGRLGELVDAFENVTGEQAAVISAPTPELPFSIKVITLFYLDSDKQVDGLSERSLPLYPVAGDARLSVVSDATHLARAVADVARALARRAATVLKAGNSDARPTLPGQLSDALMRSLEGPVLAALPQIIESLRDPDPDVARAAVRDALLQQARKKALDLFDEAFPLSFPDASARAIAQARRDLRKDLWGVPPAQRKKKEVSP